MPFCLQTASVLSTEASEQPACQPTGSGCSWSQDLVSHWDGHLIQLQLQPQGMCLVQCLRTQLEQPRPDWEASWPNGLGQEEEGLRDEGNACRPR